MLIVSWLTISFVAVLLAGRAVPRSGPYLHLFLVLLVLCSILAPWLAPRKRFPGILERSILSLALSGAHLSLFAYYGLLLVGVRQWGAVPAFDMIDIYARHLPELMESLRVSPCLIGVALGSISLMVFLIYFVVSARLFAALASTSARLRKAWTQVPQTWRRRLPLAIALGIIPALALGRYAWARVIHREPILMAFYDQARLFGGMETDNVLDPDAIAKDRDVDRNYVRSSVRSSKNLILISVDALRYDQMGVYGLSPDTTPYLSSLHQSGELTRIDKVYSVCTFSLCGMPGILTSKYWEKITLPSFNLADVLHRNGYRTSFLLSGDHTHFLGLRPFYGSNIDTYRDGASEVDAPVRINDDANVAAWLRQLPVARGEPQFIYMHLMAVHDLGLHEEAYRRWRPDEAPLLERLGLQPMDFRYARNYYRNAVLQTDAQIRQLFDILRDKHLLDDCVVIITADHGQYLGEFNRLGHGWRPYEPVVRIPLLIYDSAGFKYPAHNLTSQVDIAATLLQRAGIPIPRNWSGMPLSLPAQRRSAILDSPEVDGLVYNADGVLFKYLRQKDQQQAWLFNLNQDPNEQTNLIESADPQLLRAMKEEFNSQTAAR